MNLKIPSAREIRDRIKQAEVDRDQRYYAVKTDEEYDLELVPVIAEINRVLDEIALQPLCGKFEFDVTAEVSHVALGRLADMLRTGGYGNQPVSYSIRNRLLSFALQIAYPQNPRGTHERSSGI